MGADCSTFSDGKSQVKLPQKLKLCNQLHSFDLQDLKDATATRTWIATQVHNKYQDGSISIGRLKLPFVPFWLREGGRGLVNLNPKFGEGYESTE